jgi:hypothetical protein
MSDPVKYEKEALANRKKALHELDPVGEKHINLQPLIQRIIYYSLIR